jgi:hypothetical protein
LLLKSTEGKFDEYIDFAWSRAFEALWGVNAENTLRALSELLHTAEKTGVINNDFTEEDLLEKITCSNKQYFTREISDESTGTENTSLNLSYLNNRSYDRDRRNTSSDLITGPENTEELLIWSIITAAVVIFIYRWISPLSHKKINVSYFPFLSQHLTGGVPINLLVCLLSFIFLRNFYFPDIDVSHISIIVLLSILRLENGSVSISTNIRWYDMLKPLFIAFLFHQNRACNLILLTGLSLFVVETSISALLSKLSELKN